MDVRNDLAGDARTAELARRHALRASLDQWWERLEGLSSTWDLETVKHLVVLNAAGFAGVATLLAGGKLPQPKWSGAAPLLGYGLGVALAIANMYLASVSYSRMREEVKERIAAVGDLAQQVDHVFDRLAGGRRFSIAGQACGWVSAMLAVASTLTIGVNLVN
ncbi:hypothetical protein [Burkholderia thailandensis]|uniref:hypothetical protein n=1 Tax=Burkholderia thailandensis TaxID=57975 RepID=UPI0004F68C86|nr:hypothetical protein [Burkholderia thailandensis]